MGPLLLLMDKYMTYPDGHLGLWFFLFYFINPHILIMFGPSRIFIKVHTWIAPLIWIMKLTWNPLILRWSTRLVNLWEVEFPHMRCDWGDSYTIEKVSMCRICNPPWIYESNEKFHLMPLNGLRIFFYVFSP